MAAPAAADAVSAAAAGASDGVARAAFRPADVVGAGVEDCLLWVVLMLVIRCSWWVYGVVAEPLHPRQGRSFSCNEMAS